MRRNASNLAKSQKLALMVTLRRGMEAAFAGRKMPTRRIEPIQASFWLPSPSSGRRFGTCVIQKIGSGGWCNGSTACLTDRQCTVDPVGARRDCRATTGAA